MFRPFSFLPAKVYLGDELVFTGRMTNIEPEMSPDGSSVRVQCLALPAVLETCCFPQPSLNVPPAERVYVGGEYRGLGLAQIADDICKQFGFGAEVSAALEDDASAFFAPANRADLIKKAKEALELRYPKVRLEPDSIIHDFLCSLAKQRGLLITDNAVGNLVFQLPTKTGNAVAKLEEGIPPLLGVISHFDPNECYSDVTCWAPKKRGQKPAMWTERNRFFGSAVRPHCFKAEDTDSGNAPGAARARMGRMLANMASWDVTLPTFRDPRGRRYRPNTTVILKAPSAMVYGRHELLVRDVTLHQSGDELTCGLGLVLPGSFSDEMPAALPWNEAL